MSIKCSTPPDAPANLEATVGDGHIVLSWDDPLDQYITKYQYSTDDGVSYTDIALTDIDSSETGRFKYTVENLANRTTYKVKVHAVNSAGNGATSAKDVVMMPAAPTGLTATPRDQRVELFWDHPGNDTITKYQYSTDGGTNFADIPDSDASTNSYNVTVLSDGTDTALANATTYTLAVRAVNPSGAGPASTGTATPMPAPAAPSGLSATPGDGQVTLSWDDPGDASITKYQYSTDGGANFSDFDGGSSASTTSYTITGLDNGVTYTLALRAVNPSGEDGVSTATAVMVPAAPKLSAAPGDGQVVLSWDNPGNPTIDEYQLSQSAPPPGMVRNHRKQRHDHDPHGNRLDQLHRVFIPDPRGKRDRRRPSLQQRQRHSQTSEASQAGRIGSRGWRQESDAKLARPQRLDHRCLPNF